MSSSHLSPAPSHLRGISSFDSSDNPSGDHGDAKLRVRNRVVQNCDAGSVFRLVGSGKQFFYDVLGKRTYQVLTTPRTDINAMTVPPPLRWYIRKAVSALDPNNGSTAAVPKIADPFVCSSSKSARHLRDFCRTNHSRHKNVRAAGLKNHYFYCGANDAWQAVGHASWVLYIPCSGRHSKKIGYFVTLIFLCLST
jgi:hypothetical protein